MKKIVVIVLIILILTGCNTKEYHVTFDTAGGNLLKSITVPKGKTIEDVEPPKKEGYLFVTWEKNGIIYNEKTPVTEDMTLTAVWTAIPDLSKEYKVIFDVNDEITEVVVNAKTTVAKPDDPSLKYYNFVGWYDGGEQYDFNTLVTKDLYLVAKFERKFLTVSFDLDSDFGIVKQQIEAGKKLMRPEIPTKLGYKFVGWYYLGKAYNFNLPIEKDITLTAVWEPIKYVTVRYLTNGGTPIDSETIIKGEKAKVPNPPLKDGYKFLYWQYNGLEYDFDLPVEETIELIAIYQVDLPEVEP